MAAPEASTKLADEVINLAGFRFSSVRLAKDHQTGGLVVAAGSHDEPRNTVGIWDTEAIKSADWLLDHRGFQVDGSVTSLEFCATADTELLVWCGTSAGSLWLLNARPEDPSENTAEYDGGPPSRKWQLHDAGEGSRHQDLRGLFAGAVSSIAVHPENENAISCGDDGSIWQLNLHAGSVNTLRWPEQADSVALYDIKYAQNAANFFTAGAAGGLRMWDLRFVRIFIFSLPNLVLVLPPFR
jgi:hypothetical protein